jgi:hypothetical protein
MRRQGAWGAVVGRVPVRDPRGAAPRRHPPADQHRHPGVDRAQRRGVGPIHQEVGTEMRRYVLSDMVRHASRTRRSPVVSSGPRAPSAGTSTTSSVSTEVAGRSTSCARCAGRTGRGSRRRSRPSRRTSYEQPLPHLPPPRPASPPSSSSPSSRVRCASPVGRQARGPDVHLHRFARRAGCAGRCPSGGRGRARLGRAVGRRPRGNAAEWDRTVGWALHRATSTLRRG